MVHFWLRAESKCNEKRVALTPSTVTALLSSGCSVSVEECPQRIFSNEEYSKILGVKMVPNGTWPSAPLNALIIGLKELPENDSSPLVHTHIMFAHCYKGQEGWGEVLGRFVEGKGLLYDLEFLEKEGRRVAAFGYYAGFAGAAVGLDVWAYQILNKGQTYPKIEPFGNEEALINHIKQKISLATEKSGTSPSVMVMGALGRCGTGACDFAKKVNISDSNIIRWDMEQTKAGGPYPEILKHNVFVNCIYLSKPITPFINTDMLNDAERTLTVITDVSCDATNPHNPIPVYYGATTFDSALLPIKVSAGPALDVIAIDHLPTLLPREASEAFCADLLPYLKELAAGGSKTWKDAENLYVSKCKTL